MHDKYIARSPRSESRPKQLSGLPDPQLMFDFSKRTLQDLQIASLDRAARHLKNAKAAWNEAVREEAMGLLAAYFLEHGPAILEQARGTVEVKSTLEFPKARSA